MNLVFYDLETTGRSAHWDQIIQIAAILTDSNFNIIDQINQTCRLKSYCLPNPEALLVNKLSIAQLTQSNLSLYNLVTNIQTTFKKWGPAIFIGYNSISYDEEILRNTFFSNLFDPYLTIKDNNLRSDLIHTIRASNYFYPEIIKSKINPKGNPILKLEQVARVNGITDFTAHDAFGDTNATIELSKIIKKKLPKFWSATLSNLRKEEIQNNILSKPFCHLETYFGRTKAYILSFIGYHPIYKWALCYDLKENPESILELNEKDFKSYLETSPKVIRNIKLNKSPLIFPLEYLNETEALKELSNIDIQDRHKFIHENNSLKNRILKFYENNISLSDKGASQVDTFAEETIYKSFLKKSDSILIDKFQNSSWSGRLIIRNQFSDERLNYFANLIIYEEQPQLLEKSMIKKINRNISDRLLSNNNEKWLTIYNAYKIVDDLREKHTDENNTEVLEFLNEINHYLETVEKKIQRYIV